jgi:hypothetical protein
MLARCVILLAIAQLVWGCATDCEQAGDAIVPAGLSVTALPGGNGVLAVIALTLHKGPSNTQLYATVKNTGDVPACDAALSVELFDQAEQSLAAGISGLLTQHFYRRTDGSGAIAACIGPGDVTVGAVLDLPSELAIEDVGHVIYRCPYFALDVTALEGLTVSGAQGTRANYHGMLVNHLDVTVKHPSVTVFPINRAQRPLGMTVVNGDMDIPPGGSWNFETSLAELGFDYLAFPAGEL